ncbi:hypothetical protein HW571_22020 [Agrobacterium genomosp. 3]|uniref:hypothetical protein n=1 Tax=Agrobacterium tomkonis TaxID=1183410 RepID=UPI001CD87ADA|nr:hypothetical protein [Agrobacterium tomkonis]MCA1878660.1 hypothetical protein [Agrobacterium tumefaciens]MCA1893885.1 hypothetical protein [Agrobacterium tomkonis]
METATIENRADFAQWAIERAARGEDDTKIAESANALGQAIVDTLLEVFDVLVPED